MAEDCVDRAIKETGLGAGKCKTKTLRLHAATQQQAVDDPRAFYGADLDEIRQLEIDSPTLAEPLHESLSIRKSDIIWAIRNEMARTVEDVLARRTRALFLNARAALAVAPEVARVMAAELGQDESWCTAQLQSFEAVAQNFIPKSS